MSDLEDQINPSARLRDAVRNKNTRAMNKALADGADINDLDHIGRTALMIACNRKNTKAAKQLIRLGADVNIKDKREVSALLLACGNASQETTSPSASLVLDLIEAGANIDIRNSTLKTPLIRASGHGFVRIVKTLIDHGADVNARDALGQTPLIMACHAASEPTIKELLESGADPNSKTTSDETAVDFFLNNVHKVSGPDAIRIAAMLADHGADIEIIRFINNQLYESVRAGIENKQLRQVAKKHRIERKKPEPRSIGL